MLAGGQVFAVRLVGAFRQGVRPSREGGASRVAVEASVAGGNSPQRLPWSKSVFALCQAPCGVALVAETFETPNGRPELRCCSTTGCVGGVGAEYRGKPTETLCAELNALWAPGKLYGDQAHQGDKGLFAMISSLGVGAAAGCWFPRRPVVCTCVCSAAWPALHRRACRVRSAEACFPCPRGDGFLLPGMQMKFIPTAWGSR